MYELKTLDKKLNYNDYKDLKIIDCNIPLYSFHDKLFLNFLVYTNRESTTEVYGPKYLLKDQDFTVTSFKMDYPLNNYKETYKSLHFVTYIHNYKLTKKKGELKLKIKNVTNENY